MTCRNILLLILALASNLSLMSGAMAAEEDWTKISLHELRTPENCQGHRAETHTKEVLEQEARAFQTLAEQALAFRAETIKVGRELQLKAEVGRPLSGADLDLLGWGLARHLELREELLAYAKAHECWLYLSDSERRVAGLSAESQLEGIMISLAAALVMYDNYLLTAALFDGDPKLRQLLNEGDSGYQLQRAELNKVAFSYNSVVKRARVRRAMRFYEEALEGGSKVTTNEYLVALIDQSPSYSMVRTKSPSYVIAGKLGLLENMTVDSVEILEREGVSLFSMLFGNAMGLVETRKGKLYQRSDVHAELRKSLRSGDILLEKTPFRLTDKLIPGYWGHAAIWLGTEQELKELELWDNPLVKKHHAEIRQGRLVVEALRSGVEMNDLEHFLNIDSVGVLRRPGLTPEERKRVILQALRQVGKEYDFNFDVESLDKVYCSKLIYLAYHGVDWPVQHSFGRMTFSPDDVAQGLFFQDSLELITFYHDGREVATQAEVKLAALMGVELATMD